MGKPSGIPCLFFFVESQSIGVLVPSSFLLLVAMPGAPGSGGDVRCDHHPRSRHGMYRRGPIACSHDTGTPGCVNTYEPPTCRIVPSSPETTVIQSLNINTFLHPNGLYICPYTYTQSPTPDHEALSKSDTPLHTFLTFVPSSISFSFCFSMASFFRPDASQTSCVSFLCSSKAAFNRSTCKSWPSRRIGLGADAESVPLAGISGRG